MQNNNRNEKIDYSQNDQREIVNNSLIKVFNNKDGEIVLNYYRAIFKTRYIDFNNTNNTYFNLGKIEAIESIARELNFLLTKSKDENEK